MNNMFTNIGTVRIPVQDVSKAAVWYKDKLGLQLIREHPGEAELDVYGGETTLTLVQETHFHPLGVLDAEGWTTVFNLRTLDPHETKLKLEELKCDPFAWLEGKYVTIFQLKDLDGNRLGFCYERETSPYHRPTPAHPKLLDGVNAIFVPVRDLEQSLDWYMNMLGFTLYNHWGTGADLGLKEGGTLITLLVHGDEASANMERSGIANRPYFGLVTEDLVSAHSQLKARQGQPTGISSSGERLTCEIIDPSGNRITLYSKAAVLV